METKRTESVWINVTPDVKKEFDNCRNDQEMQEQIIREYITKEKEWLNESLEEFDKSELIYKCSLVKIKDSFKKAHDEYVNDISDLYVIASVKNKQLKEELEKPKKTINELNEKVNEIKTILRDLQISSIIQKMESFMSLIERFNNLSSDDKNIIKLLIEKQNDQNKY